MSSSDSIEADRYLRLHQVIQLVPVSKSTIWRWIRAGTFPGPAKCVARIRLWSFIEVRNWMTDGQWVIAK